MTNQIYLQWIFSEGSNLTPAHRYPDFRFKTYAPLAFRYFRELFHIKPDDYLVSSLGCILFIPIIFERLMKRKKYLSWLLSKVLCQNVKYIRM